MRQSFSLIGLLIVAGVSGGQETAANPLDGKRFLSVDKLPGGERPDGTINQIHWAVHFKRKSFSWLHYDKVISGGYEYDPRTGRVKTDDRKIEASFDTKTGILTWGKHKYKADSAAK